MKTEKTTIPRWRPPTLIVIGAAAAIVSTAMGCTTKQNTPFGGNGTNTLPNPGASVSDVGTGYSVEADGYPDLFVDYSGNGLSDNGDSGTISESAEGYSAESSDGMTDGYIADGELNWSNEV